MINKLKNHYFEDRATPYAFRLHSLGRIKNNKNQDCTLEINTHYGLYKTFFLSEEYYKPEILKSGYEIEASYVGNHFMTDSLKVLVEYIKKTYRVIPIFPNDFNQKVENMKKELFEDKTDYRLTEYRKKIRNTRERT